MWCSSKGVRCWGFERLAHRMTTLADPRPIPPEQPLPMDCCDSGCTRCVTEIYADELEHFEAELANWETRRNLRHGGHLQEK